MPEMRVDEIFVSGGGAHNPTLMAMLRKAMDTIPVMHSDEVGLDVDAKEAIAFAVMAYETAHERPSNIPKATGARRSVVLGKLTPNGPQNGQSDGDHEHDSATVRSGSSSGRKEERVAVLAGSRGGASHKARPSVKSALKHAPATNKAKAAAR